MQSVFFRVVINDKYNFPSGFITDADHIIRERTMAGLTSARARGKLGGRPRLLNTKKIALAKAMYKDKQIPIKDICKTLGIGKTTFYRYINEDKIKKSK